MSIFNKFFGRSPESEPSSRVTPTPFSRVDRMKIIIVNYFTDSKRPEAAAFLRACKVTEFAGGIEIDKIGLRYTFSEIAQKTDSELGIEIRRAVTGILS